jgi:hypothetical protein
MGVSDMASKRTIVTVCRQGISALEEPRILFEANGKLYLSAAVLEYDPKHPGLTDEQRQAMEQLRKLLETGTKVHAVEVEAGEISGGIIGAHTVGPGVEGQSY